MRSMATYVYCVVQARRPRAAGRPAGLSGLGPTRLLSAGDDLWLVVADAPLPRYGEAAIAKGLRDLAWVSRCALSHEAVVESWLGAKALVPMKLFTIFDNDVKAIAEIAGEKDRLERVVERVGGKVEWGLRVRHADAPPPTPSPAKPRGGAGYLTGKKRAWEAARRRAGEGQARAEAAFSVLSTAAAEADRRPPPAGGQVKTNLLLDAIFLVEVSKRVRFRSVARRLTRDLQHEGYRVELSGPWPPYNFVEV